MPRHRGMGLPPLIKHNGILGFFREYPEGSVERAKSLGGLLWGKFSAIDATVKNWVEIKGLCVEERIWEPLGFDSFDSFFVALTGCTVEESEAIKIHEAEETTLPAKEKLVRSWVAFLHALEWLGWEYDTQPKLHGKFKPDLWIKFPCKHSDCDGCHTLLATVEPFDAVEDFEGLPCMDYPFGYRDGYQDDDCIGVSSSAALGNHPSATWFEMGHGAGGGDWSIEEWLTQKTKIGFTGIETIWMASRNRDARLPTSNRLATSHQH